MEKVSKTLQEHLLRVTDAVERVQNYDENLPQIEVDILLSALRDMYESACMLRTPAAAEVPAPAATEAEPAQEVYDPENTPEEQYVEVPQPSLPEEAVETAAAAVACAEETAAMKEESVQEPDAFSPLMVDAESPSYAEEESAVVEGIAANSPTMEEVEGQPNETLFEEPQLVMEEPEPVEQEPEPVVEETPEPVEEQPVIAEQQPVEEAAPLYQEEREPESSAPQTLWEQLQQQENEQSIGDRFAAARTISDTIVGQSTVADSMAASASIPTGERMPEPQQETIPQEEPPLSRVVEVEEVTVEEPQSAAEVPQQPEPSQPKPQSSLFDYFNRPNPAPAQSTEAPAAQSVRTLADSLGDKMKGSEAEHAANKVYDLRTVININDKFSFMNELFHNNMKGYNDFILRLNDIESREEALAYVDAVSKQYGWDSSSQTVATFQRIFDRKF